MKAVYQTRYGSLDHLELREVDAPSVAPDEVLVRVRAASVHPDVWHVIMGRPFALRFMGSGLTRPKNPIPGTDMAGVVASVGGDVTAFAVGDEVFGETMSSHQWTHGGAYAEFVSVRQEWLAPKPANVTFEEAASVPTSGFIALINLRDVERMGPGRRVLVNGAGGGVGSLALQIVKAHGAHVTAVDCAGKMQMLRRLGADRVLDYAREDFTRSGERYDLVFDVPGNHSYAACTRTLKPDGRYVLIGHERFGAAGGRLLGIMPRFFGLMARSRVDARLRGPGTPHPTRREALLRLADLLASGALTPVIDSTYPLHEVQAAFRHLVQDELGGKVVLAV